MSLTVKELADKLDDLEDEHPDAEIKVDPPYSSVLSACFREDEGVFEISH